MNNKNNHSTHSRTSGLFLAILAITALFLPIESAHALSFFNVPSTDLSITLILSKLFSSALPAGVGGTGGFDPFAGMLGVINGAALTIGGIIAAYTLVAGTMQTAHDGEMLGKRWSSMWLPIRTTLGIGLAVPMGSGYCVAQFLVMWLAVQGIGLADAVWHQFLVTGMKQLAAYAVSNSPNVTAFAEEALRVQVCMATLDRAANMTSNKPLFSTSISTETAPIQTDRAVGFAYGFNFGSGAVGVAKSVLHPSHGAACGSMITPLSPTEAATASSGPGASDPNGFGFVYPAVNVGYDSHSMSPILDAHRAQSQALMTSMATIAQTITDPAYISGQVDVAKYDDAVKKYRTEVTNAALNIDMKGQLDQVVKNADESGWIMAGAWFARVATLMNDMNKAVNAVPQVTYNASAPDVTGGIVSAKTLTDNQSNARAYYLSTGTGSSVGMMGAVGIDKETSTQDAASQDNNWITRKIIGFFSDIDVTKLKSDTRHPLITAQELGTSLLKSSSALIAAIIGIGMASPTGGLAGTVVAALVLPAFAGGVALAIYTPVMPFILYITACFAWVLMIVEAMVAAPLWAIMHLSPAGDDLMGSSKNGYSLLLSLMLRPALIVVGFCAAVMVSYPFGIFLNAVFFQSFLLSANNGESLWSFVMLISATLVYSGILIAILHKCFALIHKIPDELLKWFGGAGASLGQAAGEANQGVRTAAMVLGSNLSNAGGQLNQAGQRAQQMHEADGARKDGARSSTESARLGAEGAGNDFATESAKAHDSGKISDHMSAIAKGRGAMGEMGSAIQKLEGQGRKTEAKEMRRELAHVGDVVGVHKQEASRLAGEGISSYGEAKSQIGTPQTSNQASELANKAAGASSASRALADLAGTENERSGHTGNADAFTREANEYRADAKRLPDAASSSSGQTVQAAAPAPTPPPTEKPDL